MIAIDRRSPLAATALALALVTTSCTTGRVPTAQVRAALRVGTSGDYAPFSLVDQEGNRRGLDIDIAERLAADLDLDLDLVPFTWPQLGDRLATGDLDMAISGITLRPDRALRALSTRPYATTGVVVLLGIAGAASDLAALDRPGRRVGVNAGGHLERWTRRNFGAATVVTVPGNVTLPDQLAAGDVDAIVTDTAEAPHWRRAGWATLGPFSADYKAIFFAPMQAALADRVDAWLANREGDGWLAARRRDWLADTEAADAVAATRHAVVSQVALRLGLMPAVAAAKRSAGLPIEDAAQEQRVLERVAAADAGNPRLVTFYRQIIDSAKLVQRRDSTAQRDATSPALSALRDAIARVDRRLTRELARTPPTAASAWRALLQPALVSLPLTPGDVEDLARALAAVTGAGAEDGKIGRQGNAGAVFE